MPLLSEGGLDLMPSHLLVYTHNRPEVWMWLNENCGTCPYADRGHCTNPLSTKIQSCPYIAIHYHKECNSDPCYVKGIKR